MDDDLLEQQRAAYAVQGVDESEPVQAGRKRKKAEYVNGEEVSDEQIHSATGRTSGPLG